MSSLAILYDYSQTWGLKINVGKSNVMIFRKRGSHNERIYWGLGRSNQYIMTTNNYKYLGIWFSTTGLTHFALDKRAEAANRAKFSLFSSLHALKLQPKLVLQLFDTLVSSVLLYGAEVWGYLIKPVNSQIEKIHTSFLRQYLGVRQSTPLLALYGELGRIPLFYVILLRMIRFWIKLLTLPSNRLAKLAGYLDKSIGPER
jgi:hypothetical protein